MPNYIFKFQYCDIEFPEKLDFFGINPNIGLVYAEKKQEYIEYCGIIIKAIGIMDKLLINAYNNNDNITYIDGEPTFTNGLVHQPESIGPTLVGGNSQNIYKYGFLSETFNEYKQCDNLEMKKWQSLVIYTQPIKQKKIIANYTIIGKIHDYVTDNLYNLKISDDINNNLLIKFGLNIMPYKENSIKIKIDLNCELIIGNNNVYETINIFKINIVPEFTSNSEIIKINKIIDLSNKYNINYKINNDRSSVKMQFKLECNIESDDDWESKLNYYVLESSRSSELCNIGFFSFNPVIQERPKNLPQIKAGKDITKINDNKDVSFIKKILCCEKLM